jgi:hypothetical protein
MEYKQIRKWMCAVPECERETTNWYSDDWLCTGLNTPSRSIESDDARRDLESAGLIEKTDLAVALICPDHAPKMISAYPELKEEARLRAEAEAKEEEARSRAEANAAAEVEAKVEDDNAPTDAEGADAVTCVAQA